ncbi:hypothetical protein [Pedobacter mendelii]|uniref:Uncharacterized protein n=1 Tax=Pedobacter mendelii TaxID=1908240 RepID=A0ABQ2BES9_9SPHI|nr:hypothetical protein [Pedobacter mendelii]GGI22443.1 hypothetical protein GCM10008119_02670 [Pedobacter mendelii]
MKAQINTKLKKNTAFVYKNIKGQNNFSTDPTANTILMTNSSMSQIFNK